MGPSLDDTVTPESASGLTQSIDHIICLTGDLARLFLRFEGSNTPEAAAQRCDEIDDTHDEVWKSKMELSLAMMRWVNITIHSEESVG